MKVLLRKMKNNLTASGVTNKKLAEELQVQESKLSECLNGKRKFDFFTLSIILTRHFKHEHRFRRNVLFKYCESIKGNLNIRLALEYAHAMGEFDLLEYLINKAKDSTSNENKEWADAYELLYKRGTEGLHGSDLLKVVEEKKKVFKTNEMKILLEMLFCYAAYDLGDYRLLQSYACLVKERIEEEIGNDFEFVKKSFITKINEAIYTVYLSLGKVNLTRECCEKMFYELQEGDMFHISQASMLFTLGESYIFENYEKSKFYLVQSIQLLQKYFGKDMRAKRERIEATLDFLKIYWHKELDILTPKDLSEQAHLEIKKGNNERAVQILDAIYREKGFLSDFQLFYLGLAKKDRGLMEQALVKFASNNIFYAQLPKKYLGIK